MDSDRPVPVASFSTASSLPHIHSNGGLTREDLYLFNEGRQFRLHRHLGAHPGSVGGVPGTRFAVWAPHARSVSVIGDFNHWNRGAHPLMSLGESGVWAGFVAGVGQGANYKYHIVSHNAGYAVDKADPVSFRMECPPRTASVVWDLAYDWCDRDWMASRGERQRLDSPWSIYEVHLGSWMRSPDNPGHVLGYRELAPRLVDHVRKMGFTHVELLPVMEHPFYGSWGYQVTGFFAPSSRHGTPQDFMFLIDSLHQAGIGVILDWVPSHFPSDEHGLAYFDGTHLYEHADPRQGHHPDWNSCIFNYGRHEVRSFLISSALFWLEVFHIDALRVDAVASMLYLDYSRREGEWIPNRHGGRENLEAIDFLRQLNEQVYLSHPDVQTIAEESTAWPKVSRPVADGGLGFGLKWDMGWMHDTLSHFGRDPIHRRWHHRELTFRGLYQHSENFVLPLSHDEVVHMKGSLLGKMNGDDWRKFAQLRLLFGYQFGQAGKKLVFMGGEWGQRAEWKHESSLDWHELADSRHAGVMEWVSCLANWMRQEPALHEGDCEPWGTWWIEPDDADNGVLVFARRDRADSSVVVCACNFTPMPRPGWRVGLPWAGPWAERLNSDAVEFGGTGMDNAGCVMAEPLPWQGQAASAEVNIPPLGVVFLHALNPAGPIQAR
ncbi:MAG: 1,4-alpha-glucan branching protein GlgB [Gemmataceae bacterium]